MRKKFEREKAYTNTKVLFCGYSNFENPGCKKDFSSAIKLRERTGAGHIRTANNVPELMARHF